MRWLIGLFSALALACVLAPTVCADIPVEVFQNRVKSVFNTKKHAVVRVFGQSGNPESPAVDICTGFFISKSGYVLTIANLTSRAQSLWIEHEGRTYSARLVGSDPFTNISILELVGPRREGYEFVQLSENLELPDPASLMVAVTCQFAHEPSPATGMVTGLHTAFCDSIIFPTTFIRSSIPHDGGESGGPVFDINGRFVGMIAIAIEKSRSSFIVPARAILRVRDDLVFAGTVDYGYVGLELDLQALRSQGLVIGAVMPGGPADKAGVRPGDRVLEFNNFLIKEVADLHNSIFFARPGQFLDMKVERDGELLTLSVHVSDQPDNLTLIAAEQVDIKEVKSQAEAPKPEPAPELADKPKKRKRKAFLHDILSR